MPKLRLTGRTAALVGVIAAAATATLVAVAMPALAAPSQQTSCTDTVRVRSQPSMTAPVIGSCTAGEKVTVDETRNGFAHLVNKQGWASVDHVAVRGGSTSTRPSTGPKPSTTNGSSSTRPSDSNSSDNGGSGPDDVDGNDDSNEEAPSGGPLGGILGS